MFCGCIRNDDGLLLCCLGQKKRDQDIEVHIGSALSNLDRLGGPNLTRIDGIHVIVLYQVGQCSPVLSAK